MNKYKIAQLVGFTVNELKKPTSNYLANIADVKHVGFGQKAEFKMRLRVPRPLAPRSRTRR